MAELPRFCGRCGRDAASAPLCNHIHPPRGCLGRQIEAAAVGEREWLPDDEQGRQNG